MKLSDCCLKIGSGATPRGGKESYLEEGPFSLIRSQNIHNNLFVRAGLAFISDVQAKQLQNVDVKPDDVLLNITGDSVARVCQVPKDVLPARVNQHVAIIRPDPTKLIHKYLHYFLVNPKMQTHMLNLASAGATRNALTKGMIESFDVPPTSIKDQKAIASVLGALDDKIENNRRMNETLEEMARAIFKSWFVDFDPVHAKAAGNAPAHMDAETAALFPNSFGDDGLPVGWQYNKLEDISDLSWGDLNTTKKSYVETGFDAYSASGKDGKLPHFDFEKLGIILSAIGANCGKTWLARGKWSCIKNTIRFWSKYEPTPTVFLFHTTRGNNFWPIRGSAQPFISQGDARSQKVIVPANGEAVSFERIVGGYYEKISTNEDENQTLAELRDTLLPKLMSGEIRVKDAEQEVEAAL